MNSGVVMVSLLLGMASAACSNNTRTFLLIVQAAGEQPPAASLGTIVVVQTQGADTIGIRTRPCLHTTAGSSMPGDASCLPIPRDLTRTYFTALTSGGACVVHAELYDSGQGTNDDGAASSVVCTGKGAKVAETEVPIGTPNADAAPEASSMDAGDDGSINDAAGGN